MTRMAIEALQSEPEKHGRWEDTKYLKQRRWIRSESHDN